MRSNSTVESVSKNLLNGLFHCERHAGFGTDAGDAKRRLDEGSYFSPLQIFITHYDVVYALCALGANAKSYNREHLRLHLAAMLKQPLLLACLLANGADPDVRDAEHEYSMPSLYYANGLSCFVGYHNERLEKIQMKDVRENKSGVPSRVTLVISQRAHDIVYRGITHTRAHWSLPRCGG